MQPQRPLTPINEEKSQKDDFVIEVTLPMGK